jgi:hypothetical protein
MVARAEVLANKAPVDLRRSVSRSFGHPQRKPQRLVNGPDIGAGSSADLGRMMAKHITKRVGAVLRRNIDIRHNLLHEISIERLKFIESKLM